MKKSILIIKSLVVAGALFLTSCNTDDSINCPEPLTGELTAKEIGFAGSWEFAAMVAEEAVDITNDDTSNPSKDIYAQYSACERDLVYDFMDNRNYTLKQGFMAPDCDNKQTLAGTWALDANNILTFVAACASQTIQLEMNEAGDAFTYVSNLNFRDASGAVKSTKVTFTYDKIVEDETPQ